MRNRIVREETCFDCNKQITVMEYEPYNASAYISVTVINGPVVNKVAVCHQCFNTGDYRFTDLGWTKDVSSNWGNVRRAIYMMRDIQVQVTDADGWHYLKSAQDHLWEQEPRDSERGSALTPVIAILTVFTVGTVLIAQSGLLHAVLARLAQVQ